MKRIWLAALAILILSVAADLLTRSEGAHGGFFWSYIPGFFALFGFIGCAAIVLISKWVGHRWLQREKDYYQRDDDDE